MVKISSTFSCKSFLDLYFKFIHWSIFSYLFFNKFLSFKIFWLHGMQDSSSQPETEFVPPRVGVQSPNHRTTTEVPWLNFYICYMVRVLLHSFACRCPVFSVSFVKKTLLSPLPSHGSLVSTDWHNKVSQTGWTAIYCLPVLEARSPKLWCW